jgi:hypothetical protein
MSEQYSSPSLEWELLEQVCINFVYSIISILYDYIFTVYIIEYCHDYLLEIFKPQIFLFTQDIVQEVLEWYHSYQCLHEYYHSLLEEYSTELFLYLWMIL